MIDWLKLTDEQRRTSLDQAAIRTGLPANAIEKDWWVTLALKALFIGNYKEHIIFKGGTSLSKCWNLIERFSEDIDIALASEAFGMNYIENPENSFLRKLKKAGYEFTTNDLKKDLEASLASLGLPEGVVKIEAESFKEGMSYPDPQTLYIHYNSLYDANEYLPNVVKIEISVRSLKEPNAIVKVQSILSATFPNAAYPETPFDVTVVEPHRTFLEKIFLLHEEFQKADVAKIRSQRMSRHLYDLVRMMDAETGTRALADKELYATIIKHRSTYIKLPGINYVTHNRETISFIPPAHIIEAYSQDYETMKSVMIYGEAPDFKELMTKLNELLIRFNV